MSKYTLGKEVEAIILYDKIKDNKKEKKLIHLGLSKFKKDMDDIINSNLDLLFKKRLLLILRNEYRFNYLKTHLDETKSDITSFYFCLINVRFRKVNEKLKNYMTLEVS